MIPEMAKSRHIIQRQVLFPLRRLTFRLPCSFASIGIHFCASTLRNGLAKLPRSKSRLLMVSNQIFAIRHPKRCQTVAFRRRKLQCLRMDSAEIPVQPHCSTKRRRKSPRVKRNGSQGQWKRNGYPLSTIVRESVPGIPPTGHLVHGRN